MLGIHSVYSTIETETQSNGYLGLLHLLFFSGLRSIERTLSLITIFKYNFTDFTVVL